LRSAYGLKAVQLIELIDEWHRNFNIQRQIILLNMLEMFLRDLMVYRDSGDQTLITNTNQIEIIENFCNNLSDAAIDKMIEEVDKCRPLLRQNVQAKMVFTTLAFRLSALMRNQSLPLSA